MIDFIETNGRSMFYLTLPSNSSMNYCANNTLTLYTTKFPKITDLDGTQLLNKAVHKALFSDP
jgi:hypothetical protein